jgi:hypothetical protein
MFLPGDVFNFVGAFSIQLFVPFSFFRFNVLSSQCFLLLDVSVSVVVVSVIFVFPSHKNNVYLFCKVYCYFVWERKFLAVRRVGLMTHREYQVDRPLPVT